MMKICRCVRVGTFLSPQCEEENKKIAHTPSESGGYSISLVAGGTTCAVVGNLIRTSYTYAVTEIPRYQDQSSGIMLP